MASPAINHAQSECGAEIRAVTVLEVDKVAGFFVRILFVRSIRWLMIEGLESMATRPCPSGSPCSSLREMALKS
eukprot:s379_g10.t2